MLETFLKRSDVIIREDLTEGSSIFNGEPSILLYNNLRKRWIRLVIHHE